MGRLRRPPGATRAIMSRVVFCGNLPLDTRQREVEDLFRKYGCAPRD